MTHGSVLIASALALLFFTATASAADCRSLDDDAKTSLNQALNQLNTGIKSESTKFETYDCAFGLAREILERRFDSYYEAQPELTLRLVREASDLQRTGQVSSGRDAQSEGNYYSHERELREKAIEVFANLPKRPADPLLRQHANLIAVLAIHQDAKAVIELAEGVDETGWLDTESRFVYLKAVASCPAYDMVSAEKMDSIILATRMKTDECSDAATKALALICPKSGKPPLKGKLANLMKTFNKAGQKCS